MATKSRSKKTPMQLWVADNRKRLGLTSADLARETGLSVDTARAWESRGRPSEDALVALARVFGVQPPDEDGAQASGDLASAIRELTVELKAAREAREEYEARLRAVEAELRSLRAGQVDAGSPERHVPPATTGSGR